MTSHSNGYRVVCPLCQTVIVSSTPQGTFAHYGAAIKTIRGHLKFACEKAKDLGPATCEAVAVAGIEAIEGAA